MGYADLPYSDKNNISGGYLWNLASYCHIFNIFMWFKIAFGFTKDDAMKQAPTSLHYLKMFNFLKTISIYLVETTNGFSEKDILLT